MTVMTLALTAAAERGRGVIMTVPTSGDVEALANEWNAGLGKEYDVVAAPAGSASASEIIAPFSVGVKAVWAASIEEAENLASNMPNSAEWLLIDSRSQTDPNTDRLDSIESTLSRSKRFLAIVPPEERARDWAEAIAPHVNAYFIPVSDLSPEGLEDLQLTAYTVTQANGRCGIGCMIDASSMTSTEAADPLLDFINRTDEFIKFFAITWPDDAQQIANLIDWLNPRVEGPKPSLGMHQDRLRPPDRQMAPEVEAQLRRWLGGISIVFLVVIVFVLFYWFRPETRQAPPDA